MTTVAELIEKLKDYDPSTPVYSVVGFDSWDKGTEFHFDAYTEELDDHNVLYHRGVLFIGRIVA